MGYPCPTCGNWSDCGYCYYCGVGTATAPAPPAPPKQPDIPISVGIYDEHRRCWYPAQGQYLQLGELLGPRWEFDPYYGAYFGPPEEK